MSQIGENQLVTWNPTADDALGNARCATYTVAKSGTANLTATPGGGSLQVRGFEAVAQNNAGASGTVGELAACVALCRNLGTSGNPSGTVTNCYGLWVYGPSSLATYAPITNTYGVYIGAQNTPGVTNSYSFYGSGTSDVFFNAGAVQLGSTITKYNNIATVSNGVPSEYATVDLTAQTAVVAATTIYTPAATGMFRISSYLKVTTAATTSSTLGGVTITFTDGTDSVAQSYQLYGLDATGTLVASSTSNSTSNPVQGSIVIYAKTGVAIKYAIGYASSGVTPMAYEAHLKVEAL